MSTHTEVAPPLIHGFLRQARKAQTGQLDRAPRPEAAERPETVPRQGMKSRAGRQQGVTAPGRRRGSGLSQHDVAQRLGVSTRLYQDWEGGVRPIPLHRVDALAEALGLDSNRRDELWFIISGGFPPRGPSSPDPDAARGWTSYLRVLQVPTLTFDAAWRIEESNESWERLFAPAGEPLPDNLLRFVLFSPYARRLCGDWESGWANSYMRQLRLEAETTGLVELQEIIADLCAVPELARLWRAVDESGRITLHDDGRLRILVPPGNDAPQYVRTLVSSPAHDPRRRVLTFLPTSQIRAAA
jgi:transcriptional regulator with XRE-family HTH domain